VRRLLAGYGWMILGLAIAWRSAAPISPCHAQQPLSSPLVAPQESKSPLGKLFGAFASKPTPAPAAPATTPAPDDPVALSSKAEPSPHLYVAIARLHQEAGRLEEAEKQFRLALEREPDHLEALLGYARLKERMGEPGAALTLYRRAVKAHPDQPVAHNNLGLCLARQNRFEEAAAAIARAVQLRPKEPLYRNNLATLLVDMGRLPEAFAHLRAVHSPAVAYYNLGYLLARKGNRQAAIQHFRMALQLDGSLVQARQWLNALEGQVAVAQRPAARVGSSAAGAAGSGFSAAGGTSASTPSARRTPGVGRTPQTAPQAELHSGRQAPAGALPPLPPADRSMPVPPSRFPSAPPSASSQGTAGQSGDAPMPPAISSLRRLPPVETTPSQEWGPGRGAQQPDGADFPPSAPLPPTPGR